MKNKELTEEQKILEQLKKDYKISMSQFHKGQFTVMTYDEFINLIKTTAKK
jgi:hypothetical protein